MALSLPPARISHWYGQSGQDPPESNLGITVSVVSDDWLFGVSP
jgi:hypothetical protein